MSAVHPNRGTGSNRRMGGICGLALAMVVLLAPEPATAAPGDILVADSFAARVVRIDPSTGARTLVSANDAPAGAPEFVEPVGIALEPDGDILVADSGALGGAVIRVDPVSGARTTLSANGMPAGGPDFVSPQGLALEADGGIVVSDLAAFADDTGGLVGVDPGSGTRSVISATGMPAGPLDFDSPFGVAVESDGGLVVTDGYAFDGGTGGVIRVDPGGARSRVSSNLEPPAPPGFEEPAGIAVAADGRLVVADPGLVGPAGGGLIRVDPDTGTRSLLSGNDQPANGPDFVAPSGLAVESDGDLLVADAGMPAGGDGQVIRVDTATGARTLVSQTGVPAGGPDLDSPVALTVVPPPPCRAGRRDRDRDGTPDACDRDDDNDRLQDRAERRLGTSSSDLDSDDDGLGDGQEDRNRNGRRGRREPHPDRFDTDRDGLSDGVELGVRRRIANPPGRVAGTGRRFRRDLQPRTRTRPVRADTDGGGVPDGEEDANHNGRRDRGERDPRVAGR